MNRKTVTYTDAPKDIASAIYESEIIEDFLPPPENLIFKRSSAKSHVVLSASTSSIWKKHSPIPCGA